MTERMLRILIVEDRPEELARYLELARTAQLEARGAASLEAAHAALTDAPFDAVLTDLHLTAQLDRILGLELIAQLHAERPELTVVAMSSDPDAAVVDRALRAGAHHFLRKPLARADELVIALELATARKRLLQEAQRHRDGPALDADLKRRCPEGVVIGDADLTLVRRAARNPSLPLTMVGETGTGKEELVKLLHRLRAKDDPSLPFVPVNCANLSDELLESALFGHRRGAFSGAAETTTGFVGEADGGILFLDEVHLLSLRCQQKLLRVLNDGSYQRVGETKTLHATFQPVVATTRDLDDEVEAGRFLLDLRMRLTGLEIRLLPLRERKHDLPLLVALFLRKAGVTMAPTERERLVARCSRYYWRGNIRQLMMALNVMAATCRDEERAARAEDLPELRTMLAPTAAPAVAALTPLAGTAAPLPNAAPQVADTSVSSLAVYLSEDRPFADAVADFERLVLTSALARHRGSVAAVCESLAIPRTSFLTKRKRYGLT